MPVAPTHFNVKYVAGVLHALSLLAGIVCIGIASMLHESEELRLQAKVKKFQCKVEAWWIKLDETKTFTLAWATSFVRGIARLTGKCFDRVFTTRLLSMRIVGISFFLSIASFFLTVLIITGFNHNIPAPISKLSTTGNMLRFCILAIYPAIAESQSIPLKPWLPRTLMLMWWAKLTLILFSISSFLIYTLSHPQNGLNLFPLATTFMGVIFIIAEACDMTVIVFTRWTLRRISVTEKLSGILVAVCLLFLLLLAIIVLPIVIGLNIVKYAQFAAFAFLFSIIRIELEEHWQKWKNWLWGLGVLFFTAAIPGLPSWVKELLSK